MMNCVILFRINGGEVQAIASDNGKIHEFRNFDEAVSFASGDDPRPATFAKLVASGQADYQIVSLDEL